MRLECKYDELMPIKEAQKRIHPDNENKHPEEQIRSLAKVIAKIGVRHAIHISKLSGKIAGGHGRLLAFKKLGYDEVPIIWENFEDELEEVNYRASDNIGQYAEFNNQEYVLNLEKVGVDIHEVDLEEYGVLKFNTEVDEVDMPDLGDGSDPDIQQMTITISNEQKDIVDEAVARAKKDLDCTDEINKNSNGNAISAIMRDYLGR